MVAQLAPWAKKRAVGAPLIQAPSEGSQEMNYNSMPFYKYMNAYFSYKVQREISQEEPLGDSIRNVGLSPSHPTLP